jgi:protocatechuate 3,4-dioxygenase beta subunit
MRALSATLLAFLLLPAAVAAAPPLQITGRILHPPKDAQVELRPWTVDYAEALRRLKGEAVPPIASARPGLDGSFAVKVPDTGFYAVVVRAEGHLAMEGFVPFAVEETEMAPVELRPTSPLEVRAVGEDGQPLAGVTIQALPLKPESGNWLDWRAAERSAVTDAEGRAVFRRAESEALTLVITTPGRYATASTNPTGASQTVRFPAQKTRTVEFRGANGKPAGGALVRLARRGWPYGLTGEDGRIPLPVPLKDEIGLFAEDSRGLRIEVVMTVEAGEGTDVHGVALKTPTPAAGRVLEASSREPVAGALVWNGGIGGMAWARTGSGGTFEIRAPSGDRGRIEAAAAGHTRALVRWQRDANEPITFLLGPGAPISGQVIDEAGKPVAGARIATVSNPAEYRYGIEDKQAWSGPDGRFVLRGLPAARVHALKAEKQGFAPVLQMGDSTAPVRIILRQGTVAVGRVVDEQGLPVAGVKLTLAPVEEIPIPKPALQFSAVSDTKGSFRIPSVSAGRFELQASRPGFTSTILSGILIPESEARTEIGEITLLPGTAIEGIVVDERGKPVQGARVVLTPFGSDNIPGDERFMYRDPVETGPDGRFRIADLRRGMRVGLKAVHPDLAAAEMAGVEAPTAEPVRLRLARPRSLEGRVKDRQGEPVAEARLFVSEGTGSPLGGWDPRSGQVKTDPEGRFVLSRLKPGTAYVTVMAAGYRTRPAQAIQIPEEGQAPPLEITLEPGTFLEGVVRDSQGAPLPNASVFVQSPDPTGLRMAVPTDQEGHYEIGDLEPGLHQVQVSLDRGPGTRVSWEIRPGRNRLDLKLPDGTEVSGRTVDSQGSPIPGANLSLQAIAVEGETWMSGPDSRTVSSGDGSFVFQGISDGEYRLLGTRQGFAPAVLPGVQVAGSPVSGLELRLGPGAVIRGRLLGLDPAAASQVRVTASSADGTAYLQGVVDPSGSYRIQDVGPGEWNLMAQFSSASMVTAQVEVSPGEVEVVRDLELPSGFTLTGRVLLDRNPLARAQVVVSGNNPERPGGGYKETAHDGTFRMERLPAGTYTLRVLISMSVVYAETFGISGDRDLTIEIATGAVEGRLLSPEGLPVAGALVSLTLEEPELVSIGPRASSDDQGAFALPGVPAGTYKLTVRADGFAPAESRVVVTPGGTVHVDLVLGPPGRD